MFKKLKQKLVRYQYGRLEDEVLMEHVHVWELPFEYRSHDLLLYVMEFRKYQNLADDGDLRYYGYALVQMKNDIDRMDDEKYKQPYLRMYEKRRRSYNIARSSKLSEQKEQQAGVLRGRYR